MRTKGFTAPSDEQWDKYAFEKDVDHKHLDLKLHPCIVECEVECADSKTITDNYWDDPSYKENANFDYLDLVSIKVYQKKKEKLGKIDKNDFKEWDKPKHDR